MTAAQFALIVGAPPKWIQNTRRLLSQPAANDAADARWLSLVHSLNTAIGLPLKTAARCADIAVAAPGPNRSITIELDDERRVAIIIDLHRDITLYLARLSRALEMP